MRFFLQNEIFLLDYVAIAAFPVLVLDVSPSLKLNLRSGSLVLSLLKPEVCKLKRSPKEGKWHFQGFCFNRANCFCLGF
ncbi:MULTISPECIES: hypothetical protein [Spirulina sp. CCY15215]|uniref:hypothetical protein n=1 Tax=Spirulina sp. CCY15215 TaxID=2767591 RepID=UPI0019525715|nr:hypothetical protein [Spirulina major]